MDRTGKIREIVTYMGAWRCLFHFLPPLFFICLPSTLHLFELAQVANVVFTVLLLFLVTLLLYRLVTWVRAIYDENEDRIERCVFVFWLQYGGTLIGLGAAKLTGLF